MKNKGLTLTRHILNEQRAIPRATGELSTLLSQISLATKTIAREVRGAGLGDILGATGKVNIQQEEVQKLDEYANQIFINVFGNSGLVCTLVSEEMEKPIHLSENCPNGKYTLFYDPLDGSSNIDIDGTIGTIFSIHRRVMGPDHGSEKELLKNGMEQVAAGYVVYGPSTVLVYTAGRGVHLFTLDATIGEYLLSDENIQIPKRGKIYSVNEGNFEKWNEETRNLITYFKQDDKPSGRPYTARYVGALVADFHRTLLQGGIFLYPGDTKNPQGKIRLLYEASPLAFVAENAGGKATTGHERILDIQPTSIHQRIPLIIGSPEEVDLAETFLQKKKKN